MKKSVEKDGPLKTNIHTISGENIFTNQTQFKAFYRLDPCLEYIKENPNKGLHAFAEDITTDARKRFYALNYYAIYELSKMKKFHMYEYYNNTNMMKLFLDIDIKQEHIPEMADRTQLFDDMINDSIQLVIDKLEIDHGIIKPEIIILKSSSEVKLSAHIIFPDVTFKTIDHMKWFMTDLKDEELVEKGILDFNVYRRGVFRLLWNSKCGKGINLEYYKGLNYQCQDNKNLFMDCLLTYINKENYEVEIIIPENLNVKNKVRQNIQMQVIKPPQEQNKNAQLNQIQTGYVFHPISTILQYVKLLNPKRADTYREWIEIGMILHNCNPTEDCFNLWDIWSQVSDNYGNTNYNINAWNSFNFGPYSIGTLKYYAKKDNPKSYPLVGEELTKPKFNSHKFTANYLLGDTEENINDNKSFVSNHIIEWMNNNETKSLAIRSCYNSGKTDIIRKILKEFKPKRVLFVSYRQTLTYELYGNFKDYGVRSYMNGHYRSNRVICQIESLHKLEGDERHNLPKYDLVIIDEIESVLNHFISTTISDSIKTFNTLYGIAHNSNKILALDGDFHNRSYDFLENLGSVKVLWNEAKKDQRFYKFTNDKFGFEKNIEDDLKNKKNVVIVSMSSKLANHFYNMFSSKYKSILHCSKSDDEIKQKLQNVNEFWTKYQLVIYSPSVESGVNCDKTHFHKIYMILAPNSTSQRGLLQMASRVRKIEDPNIMVFLNNMPFCKIGNYYVYDEVKEYVCEIYNKYFTVIPKLNKETNKFTTEYEFNIYHKIIVHNETEKANKNSNLFGPYLLKLLKEKGHEYDFIDEEGHFFRDKDKFFRDEIFNSKDITEEEYYEYTKKLSSNKATREEKVAIEKYEFKVDWKQEQLTKEFMEKYYGKSHVLWNLKILTHVKHISPYEVRCEKVYQIVFDTANMLEQIITIKGVIRKLGFKFPPDGTKINKETFEENIILVKADTNLFLNPNKSQHLFGFDKVRLCKVKDLWSFLNFINNLFGRWGLKVNIENKQTSKIIDGKKKTIPNKIYFLDYIDNLNFYIQ